MKIPDLKNIIYNEEALIDFLLENDVVMIPVCNRCQEPMTHINIWVISDEMGKNVPTMPAYLEVVFFKTHI
jgi:hypothetical protein